MLAKRVFLLLVVVLFSAVFCIQLSRITHLLHFLNTNVGAEPGSYMRLHPAYYGTEILHTLSKHPGYIQKNVLLASDYTYKLATFVSTLQSNVESDGDFGGFQTFPSEKKDFEVYDGEFVSSVVNSYFAGRVLEISDSPLGGGQENYFKRVDAVAALKFLARSRKDGLYVLYPGAEEVSVASLYYGVKAWQLFSAYAEIPAGTAAIQPESVAKFLKELFHEGGFKHSVQSGHADLQSTYQAVSLLKLLNLWDSFTSTRNDAKESLQKFVLSFRDATTRAFGVPQPDVAHTFWAVSIAKQLGLEHVVDTAAIAKFVISLQSPEDGGFKLHLAASSGHFINTFYALETLEALGKVSLLEDTLVQTERLILAPQFIHNAAFVAVVVLVLVAFSGALYLLPHSEEDELEEEEGVLKAKGKDKSKKKKKEPTMTIIRDKETKECVDKDGVPYPIDNLNKKEWDIIETKETEKHTIYTLRKKDVSLKQKVKDSPLKARRTHKK